MEICTQHPLPAERIREQVPQIIAWLEARLVREVEVMHGWGRAPMELAYEPMRIALSDVLSFIERSEADGLFEFAGSDLWIKGGDVDFLLCHEADIHVISPDPSFIEVVKADWIAKGFEVHNINRETSS